MLFLGFAWFCIIAASDYACASSQDQWMMQLVENYQVGFGLPNFGPNYMIKKTPKISKIDQTCIWSLEVCWIID